jgi:iron complex transport system ATP-binding protein
VRVRAVLQHLREHEDRTLFVVTHDVDASVFRGDRVLALREGRLLLDGAPDELLAGDTLKEIYGTAFDRLDGPGGVPVVIARGETP